MKVLISSFVLFLIALSTNSAVNAVECPEGQDHEISFLPSPVDCSKYYVCVHSEPIEMECPAGLWFNNELNVCDFPDNVVCGADCQEPWVRPGSSVACYASGGEKGMKWNDAVKKCASMGGFLAEPRTDFETKSIKSIVDSEASYWIGLCDCGEEGNFRWLSDSSDVTYSNWGKNEPNNTGGKQDCVQLWVYRDHQWDDQQCSRTSNKKGRKTTPIVALCQK